jgi:hypothetical protein
VVAGALGADRHREIPSTIIMLPYPSNRVHPARMKCRKRSGSEDPDRPVL